jgi:glycolate oxidase
MIAADEGLGALRAALPATAVLTDSAAVAAYRHDQARFCPAGWPLAVVRPTSTGQVRDVLRVADRFGLPVVPQGARTGMSGGANAVDGCVVLSMTAMDAILEIDEVEQVAVVQPGVSNAALARAALARGLHYPPDPAARERSTVGGNLSTNAGGPCCVRYRVAADFVRGLEVVLPGGDVLRTGRRGGRGAAGYDLTRLLVGAEGTLGVITEAILALRPAPAGELTAAVLFPGPEEALAAVTEVMAGGIRPSLLEFLDAATIRAVGSYRQAGFPAGARAMLLAQAGGPAAAAHLARMVEIFDRHGAVETVLADDAEQSALLLEARRVVRPAVEALGSTLVEDVAVPRSRMVDLVRGIDGIAARWGLLIACLGHAGDGSFHPTVVFEPGDPDAERRATEAFAAIMELTLRLGGTATGEHGVGLLKRVWLEREIGPVGLRLQRRLRAVFDPRGILNPGKVL